MESRFQTFHFEKYTFDPEEKVAQFHYSFDRELYFVETLKLHVSRVEEGEALDRVLFNLHLALGISYWKAYCASEIKIESGKLSRKQADFWNTVYTKGLGEFFYQNRIDFRGLLNFPYGDDVEVEPVELKITDDAMVLLGGGKDSLVTVELMKKMEKKFDVFTLNRYPVIDAQIERIGAPHHWIERTIDPALMAENEKGALNGHVPISMIYAFTALLMAVVEGHRYIVLSNEHSSNYGNVEYLSEEVNHQWSKSFEFEKLFSHYVRKFVTSNVEYFSLLRPLHEIQIAKIFAVHGEWLDQFTSCNTNFRIAGPGALKWCGKCAKCAFVFALLAPFVEREKLVAVFGKDLLADSELASTYAALRGETDVKPFDCVGTPEEVKTAMKMTVGETVEDFKISDEHLIPEEFQSFLNELQ